jgi:uncharacterized membrane protein
VGGPQGGSDGLAQPRETRATGKIEQIFIAGGAGMFKIKTTKIEVVERQKVLAGIRHSSEVEGGRSSEAARKLQERWARGEITAKELVEQTKDLHQN